MHQTSGKLYVENIVTFLAPLHAPLLSPVGREAPLPPLQSLDGQLPFESIFANFEDMMLRCFQQTRSRIFMFFEVEKNTVQNCVALKIISYEQSAEHFA